MKKIIVVLLILVMLFSLVACNSGRPDSNDAGSTETQQTSSGDSPTPAAPPSGGTVGWSTDNVDYFARPAYRIAYIVAFFVPVNALISDQFELWGKVLNFEYTLVDAQRDNDLFITSLEMLAGQGYDGFILDFDPAYTERCYEVCVDLGINWISGVNPVLIGDKNMWPGVTIESYPMGGVMAQWLFDNYKGYWGDIDVNELGILICDLAPATDLHLRAIGANDKFTELLPGIAGTNIFWNDMPGMDPQIGYDQFTAVKSGNPQFKYWMVVTVVDVFAQGVVRAAEDLGVDNSTLVLSADGNVQIAEWDSGYTGDCLTGAAYVAPIYQTEPIICGLIAMIDGRATPESLWPEWKAPGASFAQVKIDLFVITRDNYKQYLGDAQVYWNSISA